MSARTTRCDIVDAAERLFYRRGYAHTSFSDIATVVRISRGNFYYHFKTKDEILDAVIAARATSTETMLAQWEADSADPADRIRRFIQILIANRTDISRYGCPVGTLATELAKLNHGAQAEANRLFTQFRTWLRRQFEQLGCGPEADALALHVLARSQGIATLATAYHDEMFIRREVALLCDWLTARVETAAQPETSRG